MSKKLCKDTEIKAFSHWHFEFSMARFWAVPVFCNKVWTIWSAYAMADYPARPKLTQKPSWQWINICLLMFLAGQTKAQVLDKGIRQKSTKRVGSIIVCSAFCQGFPKRNPLDSEKMACLPKLRISRIMPQTVLQLGKVLRVYTSTDAKWLSPSSTRVPGFSWRRSEHTNRNVRLYKKANSMVTHITLLRY